MASFDPFTILDTDMAYHGSQILEVERVYIKSIGFCSFWAAKCRMRKQQVFVLIRTWVSRRVEWYVSFTLSPAGVYHLNGAIPLLKNLRSSVTQLLCVTGAILWLSI